MPNALQPPSLLPIPPICTDNYYCTEIDSEFHCDGSGGMLYGSFDGFLGQGLIHLIRSLGDDVWALAFPRVMYSQAPGDWIVVVHRGGSGNVSGVTVGCWLEMR